MDFPSGSGSKLAMSPTTAAPPPNASPGDSSEEASLEYIRELQEFFATLSEQVIGCDEILSFFSQEDLQGSMNLAITAKFSEYWSMDRLLEMHNKVDQGLPPESLKSVFKPGASKNYRVRANKIGNIILERVKELYNKPNMSNLPPVGSPQAAASMRAHREHEDPPRMTSPVEITSAGHWPEPREFVFSPEVPDGAELRVRELPSTNSQIVTQVSRATAPKIVAVAQEGLWLKVQGYGTEAWMMWKSGDTQLLIHRAEAEARIQAEIQLNQKSQENNQGRGSHLQATPLLESSTVPGRFPSAAVPERGLIFSPVKAPANIVATNESAKAQNLISLSPEKSATKSTNLLDDALPFDPLAAMRRSGMTINPADQRVVPYEEFENLKIKVAVLEETLTRLKQHLRMGREEASLNRNKRL
eukprot:UC4_evm6s1221